MNGETIHTTIGVYADGSYKTNGVKHEHLKVHIEYNKTMRFGRALFVDGKCVHNGYLNSTEVKEFEEKIKKENIKKDKCTAPYH